MVVGVKVPTWIVGQEEEEFVGVGARFGPTLESKEKDAVQIRLALADPPDCCSKPINKLTGEVILVYRGNCSFTATENALMLGLFGLPRRTRVGHSYFSAVYTSPARSAKESEHLRANVAEAAGASAILITNNHTELFKMVCETKEPDVDVNIPAVMLPQDAGASLIQSLQNNSKICVQLYSPKRPLVDVAEVFLWLMAVGTILCASAWSAREAGIEQDKI